MTVFDQRCEAISAAVTGIVVVGDVAVAIFASSYVQFHTRGKSRFANLLTNLCQLHRGNQTQLLCLPHFKRFSPLAQRRIRRSMPSFNIVTVGKQNLLDGIYFELFVVYLVDCTLTNLLHSEARRDREQRDPFIQGGIIIFVHADYCKTSS